MIDFAKLNEEIGPADAAVFEASVAHWDNIAKPLKGLGDLEVAVSRIASLTGNENVILDKRLVIAMCADNGVVAEGVTQSDPVVTAAVAANMREKTSSVCLMAKSCGTDVLPVDIGMLNRVEGVRDCHVANGTKNLAVEPAMTKEEACTAIQHGMDLVKEAKEQGYKIIVTGEMGIGNTTTSAAVAAVLLGMEVEDVTGRGAGLSDDGLKRKIAAIKRGIEVNKPDASDPLDVLSKLGGFDIAGLCGVFLGGALYKVPVVIDGLISAAAALIAARMCPESKKAMIASHCSAEPAAIRILNELDVKAIIFAGLKLGEGTGAVCMLPLIDMALAVYHGSASFAGIGIDNYTIQEGDDR